MDTVAMVYVQQLLLISINKMKYDEGYNFMTEVTSCSACVTIVTLCVSDGV